MVNYLEKLVCVEILEKISRMQRFISSETDASRSQDKEVISVFLRALDAILDNIKKPTIERLSSDIELEEWERVAIMRRLSDASNSIDRLHLQLQFIYGVWVKPETHIFIKRVLELIPGNRAPKSVNVILSNIYSFSQTELSSYIEDIVGPASIRAGFQNQSLSVFLPKIERDNLLNWTILTHECGHCDSQGIQSLLRQPGIIPPRTNDNDKDRTTLQNWVSEIYCDLFAAKILGPAYLASFATFIIVSAGAGRSEFLAGTHPPDIIRISIIYEILKDLKVNLSSPILGFNDISSYFYNILEGRIKLDRQHNPFFFQKQQSYPQLNLGRVVDKICEEVDRIISLNRKLTITDFARINKLKERLSKGILVGSYQNPQLIKEAKKKFSEGRIDSQKLEEAKSAVQESKVLIWEIVNAGWLHKIEDIYPQAFSLFFGSDNTPIEEKIAGWGEELEGIDRLLLKSIEASEIQGFMEEEKWY